MTLAEAIAVTEKYQAWRLDASEELPHPLKAADVTEALECLLACATEVCREAEREQFP